MDYILSFRLMCAYLMCGISGISEGVIKLEWPCLSHGRGGKVLAFEYLGMGSGVLEDKPIFCAI